MKKATITLTYADLRTLLLEEIMTGIYYGEQDEEKVATIVNRSAAILEEIFWDDDADKAPTIPARAARRVLYQVKGTYEDAVYTAQTRASQILNALRGL